MSALTPEMRDAVLAHINTVREALSLKPLDEIQKGVRSKCYTCPVAASIGDVASVAPLDTQVYTFHPAKRLTFKHSELVTEFIHLFDLGRIPELVRPLTDIERYDRAWEGEDS